MSLLFTMLIGPCGAGKTTYAAELLKRPDTHLLSPDALRDELSGFHCVYDATCYNRKNRKGIIAHAQFLGYEIEAHVFRTPIEVCKARNAGRERRVPDEVIDRQFARWQEPELSEGFARIVEVPHAN